jgi:hypothetical protein
LVFSKFTVNPHFSYSSFSFRAINHHDFVLLIPGRLQNLVSIQDIVTDMYIWYTKFFFPTDGYLVILNDIKLYILFKRSLPKSYMNSSTFCVHKTNPTKQPQLRKKWEQNSTRWKGNRIGTRFRSAGLPSPQKSMTSGNTPLTMCLINAIATKINDKWQYSTNDVPYQCQA